MEEVKFIKLTQGQYAMVDEEDFDRINKMRWHHGARQYAIRNTKDSSTRYMHKMIIGADENQKCDHINGDTLDNRKSNLRLCTQQQNLCNRQKKKKSKSGYKGVYKDKSRNAFAADISHMGVRYRLGRYKTAKKAAIAYDGAARKYHGEFARLNFPNG